jgi:hypothetical protein
MFEEPMEGCCPFVASTDREKCCNLGGICWGNQSTCQDRRRTTCKHSDGEYCDKYDECDCKDCRFTPPIVDGECVGGSCSCKDCETKTECVALNCGEICACRMNEEENFKPKGE